MGREIVSHPHRHRVVTMHTIGQLSGVPYEVERLVCATCGQVLESAHSGGRQHSEDGGERLARLRVHH